MKALCLTSVYISDSGEIPAGGLNVNLKNFAWLKI